MPLYRTNSDRGLWKKYREPQPQHFHKPNYLELDKRKPQVTYSQLQLGENYRSYNNRQSHPNLRAAVTDSAAEESAGSGTGDRWATRRRRGRSFSTKSAPATPRATTPTRQKYKMNGDDFKYEDVIRAPGQSTGHQVTNSQYVGYSNRPTTVDPMYRVDTATTPSGYPDSESGFSLESRSLAGYSAGSSTGGRDWNAGYRYPYAAEPIRHGVGRLGYVPQPQEPDRPNPFTETENSVVQMFLMNTNLGHQEQRNMPQLNLNPSNPGRIENLESPTGPLHSVFNGQMYTSSPLSSRNPDEDTETSKSSSYARTVISQLRKDFLSSSPPKPSEPEPEKKTNKYLKPENRWSGPPPPSGGPMSLGTNGIIEDTVTTFQAPQIHHAEVVTLRQDTSSESEDETIMEQPVKLSMPSPMASLPYSVNSSITPLQPVEQQENDHFIQLQLLQQKHLLEQQQLEREFKEQQLKFNMQEKQNQQQLQNQKQQNQQFSIQQQLQNQKQQLYQKQFQPHSLQPHIQHQPQSLQPQQQLNQGYHHSLQYNQQPRQTHHQSQPLQPPQPQQNVQEPQRQFQPNTSLNRSYEDPAYANFHSLQQESSSPSSPPSQTDGSPGKKKGFFSSFFKKPTQSPPRKGRVGKGKRPRSDYIPDDEYDDQGEDENIPPDSVIPKSSTDGDLRLHTLECSPHRLSPVVPQPGTAPKALDLSAIVGLHKNASMITHPGMSFEQEFDPYDEEQINNTSFEDTPQPQQLQRKLSMSKPTDLDELMRLQEEQEHEEQMRINLAKIEKQREKAPPLPIRTPTAEEVFKNDPWFQSQGDNANGPIYQNTLPTLNIDISVDTTQEIDIDALLGYGEEEEYQMEMDQEPPVIRQIEEIIWPKSEPEPNDEEDIEDEVMSPPHGKSGPKKITGFFKFATDKSHKNKKEDKKGKKHAKKKFEEEPEPVDQVLESTEPEPQSEPEPQYQNVVVDVIENITNNGHEVDHVEEDYIEESFEKKPTKRGGFSSLFAKPNWKPSKISKKPQQDSRSPPKIGEMSPVDVSHLLDDDFGIEEPLPPPQELSPQQTDTDTDANLDQDVSQEETDQSPVEAPPAPPPQKSLFKLKTRTKKKPKEEKEEPKSRPVSKFFKPPSWKSPNTKKRTPKSSPNSKVPQTDENDETKTDSDSPKDEIQYSPPQAEVQSSPPRLEDRQSPSPIQDDLYSEEENHQSPTRSEDHHSPPRHLDHHSPPRHEEHQSSPKHDDHHSPPRHEDHHPRTDDPQSPEEFVQQMERLDIEEPEIQFIQKNIAVEPSQVFLSEDERMDSTTADEGRDTSDETGKEEDILPEPELHTESVVSLPVEMEEPEPTEPKRGRPKTQKKKSAGSGFAALFSSRPSSRTREKNKREEVPEINHDMENPEEPEVELVDYVNEPNPPEDSFQNRRRSESKGFGALFASKRKPGKQRPRPVSGPPAEVAHYDDEQPAEPYSQDERREESPPPVQLRRQKSSGFGSLFSSRRGPPAKSTGNLAERRREVDEPVEKKSGREDEKQSYSNSTSSLGRPKREKGFGAFFGAPKSRQSGRKSIPRSTTFPLANPPQDENYPPEPESEPEPQREIRRVQESPNVSLRHDEDQRPPLPLPKGKDNQYSPTPRQPDIMVYDQIEVAAEQTPPREEIRQSRPEPPKDPNRQMGRRSGRFKRPQDGSPGNNDSMTSNRQISSGSIHPSPGTTQSVMRDIFAETVTRKSAPVAQASSRHSNEDSIAASGLGPDFEYEKAMRNPARVSDSSASRSRQPMKKSTSGVSRTDSYKQAAPIEPGNRKPANYNSLPRLGGRTKQRQPQKEQPPPADLEDNANNYDTRSLGDRPRSRNARSEDPCSVM